MYFYLTYVFIDFDREIFYVSALVLANTGVLYLAHVATGLGCRERETSSIFLAGFPTWAAHHKMTYLC